MTNQVSAPRWGFAVPQESSKLGRVARRAGARRDEPGAGWFAVPVSSQGSLGVSLQRVTSPTRLAQARGMKWSWGLRGKPPLMGPVGQWKSYGGPRGIRAKGTRCAPAWCPPVLGCRVRVLGPCAVPPPPRGRDLGLEAAWEGCSQRRDLLQPLCKGGLGSWGQLWAMGTGLGSPPGAGRGPFSPGVLGAFRGGFTGGAGTRFSIHSCGKNPLCLPPAL